MEDNGKSLFEAGIKPALLLSALIWANLKLAMELEKKGFPKAEGFIYKATSPLVVLFQNESLKQAFLENGIRKNGKFDERAVGLALGYPPSAVEAYAKKIPFPARAGITYHGFSFITRAGLIEENIEWLRKNMPVPAREQKGIKISAMRLQNEFWGWSPVCALQGDEAFDPESLKRAN